ncbi:MAG: hypothetical protein IT282_14810 [Bacteroidetes bacterium]|nr:hypothetical protein [Bacteroidota bacterium]
MTRSTPEFRRLSALHDRSNAVAATIRTMDQAMQTVGTTMDAMKKELEMVTKNYPPFPPGSEERIRRLRGYTGLRAMIDKLALAPEADERTLAVRAKEVKDVVTDDWTFVIEPNGMTRTVWSEDVKTGPLGLRLPELSPPESVSDQDIARAVQYLDDATVALQARRERLREQTFGIPGSSYDQGMDEVGAETTSGIIRRDIAGLSVGLVEGGTAQLEQLLG